MVDKNLEENPFAALFESHIQAAELSASLKSQLKGEPPGIPLEEQENDNSRDAEKKKNEPETSISVNVQETLELNDFLERVFLVTLNPEPTGQGRPMRCVYLRELHSALKEQDWLDLNILGQVVFERLMLAAPGDFVISTSNAASYPKSDSATETAILPYLYACYARLHHEILANKKLEQAWVAPCESVIKENLCMCFQQPIIFGDLSPAHQFLDIYIDEYQNKDGDLMLGLFEHVALEIDKKKEDGNLHEAFTPVLQELHKRIKEVTLGHSTVFTYLDVLTFFTRKLCLTEVLLDYMQPADQSKGKAYEDTLLGALLSISCLLSATQPQGRHQFFDRPSRFSKQEHDITEASIHQPISVLNERIYQLIYAMIKHGSRAKHRILDWLGKCLATNKGRAKMWAHHMPLAFVNMYAGDGFMVNLCAVLLRLCQPFSFPKHPRLLKIQPSYCRVSTEQYDTVHLKELDKETYLIPLREGQEPLAVEEKYSFVTECFFMTHQALYLGLHVVYEKFLQLNQDLHRIQSQYQEMEAQGQVNQQLRDIMEQEMTHFLCMKAALTEPLLLDLCFNFLVATATYLTHVAVHEQCDRFELITFPLPEQPPLALTSIPEFVAENILDFMVHIRRFKDSLYEIEAERLKHLMTFVLVFMGSPERMRNPHFRARLAEALETLMPPKTTSVTSIFSANFHRKQLFLEHPLITELAGTLMHVFVSIEMTGQAVQFEQKFNYRRPMYAILEYIWDIDVHHKSVQALAEYAEEHMEDYEPPLFLRFINLLINDAIFLLDEALSYMAQIKEKQEEQARGEWEQLGQQQRGENVRMLRQLTMLARFHNMMALDTIKTLQLVSASFSRFVTKDILVDRIAAMLNYFLLHLVGPKKKNLKVKDFDKYEFKPQELLSIICQIYLNLGEQQEFCMAVAQDGRSYSHNLFIQAQQVLIKIHKPQQMIDGLVNFGRKVKTLSEEQAAEDEAVADAPDDFLDPIMGTLMKDPVLLPSQHTVDRSTIARHLLSDQTDPFSRQPMSMEMVKPNMELKERIDIWLTGIRAKIAAQADSESQTDTQIDSLARADIEAHQETAQTPDSEASQSLSTKS